MATSSPGACAAVPDSALHPYLRVADVPRLAEIKLKHPRIKLLIDSTLGTPFNFRPLELGADLVTHSCSKYLAGHNDVLSGALCGGADLIAALRDARGVFGGMPDPHGAYLLIRGLKTLGARMRQHNQSGERVARFLAQHTRRSSACTTQASKATPITRWRRGSSGGSAAWSASSSRAISSARGASSMHADCPRSARRWAEAAVWAASFDVAPAPDPTPVGYPTTARPQWRRRGRIP